MITGVADKHCVREDWRGERGWILSKGKVGLSESPWVAAVALIVLVGLTYAPALDNGFIYDDRVLVLGETAQAAAADLSLVFTQGHYGTLDYYRPLARLTMALQTSIHGNRPAPFHAFNVGLMGLCAVVAYCLFRSSVFSIRRFPAFLAAALIGVHPISAQCAYPVTGRETLMAAIAAVGAFYAFVRPGRPWKAIALVLLAIALLCKEQAIVLPVLFLLADLLGVSADAPGRALGSWIRRYVPVVAVVTAYLFLRPGDLSDASGRGLALVENPGGPLASLAYGAQVTFAPFRQLVYEPGFTAWFSPARLFLTSLALLGLGVLAYRSRKTSGSRVLFWLGWFVIAMGPTLNIVVQEARFAERYEFLSLFGAAGIAATIASSYWSTRSAKWIATVGLILVLASATISFGRDTYFADDLSFNTQWLLTDPTSGQAHANFGQMRYEEGRLDDAVDHFRKAIDFSPQMSPAHTGLANVFFAQGRIAEAIPHYRNVVELSRGSALSLTNLGAALGASGQFDEAAVVLEQAMAIRPDSAPLLFNLATVRFRLGEFERAAGTLKRAADRAPGDPETARLGRQIESARQQLDADLKGLADAGLDFPERAIVQTVLGRVLGAGGDPEGATVHLKHALELAPDFAEAHRFLGYLLQNQGRYDEAADHYREAIRADPEHPDAHFYLARILQAREDHSRAIEHYRIVLASFPDHAESHFYLAQSLEVLGDPVQSKLHYSEAFRLDPKLKPPDPG